MRKILPVIMLCLIMTLALVGCGTNVPASGTADTKGKANKDILKISVAAQNNSGQVF